MNDHPAHTAGLAGLAETSYIRERIDPRPGDAFYLHLSDLLLALRPFGTQAAIRILDYGCGGSPYRSLFPNADYRRADLRGVPDIDFEIDAHGVTGAPAESFDLVLSTQALEHCASTHTYLRECHRVLKKNGRLLLTTHGLFEEHGCPYDFFRWTEDGLRMLIRDSGFRVDSIARLTMGPRAGLMLLQRSAVAITFDGGSLWRRAVWTPCRRFLLLRRRFWDPLMDRAFPQYRVSGEARLPGDNIYIGLLAVAEKH